MAVIDLKKATLTFVDGTPTTPNTLEVKIGEGNLTYDEKVNREYIKDKGVLSTVRNGDEEPMDVKLDFMWEFLYAGDAPVTPTPEDVLKQRGGAAAWVSSDSDACAPYAVDITILYEPDCDTINNELIVLPDFRYETLSHDMRAGSVSVTGKCNATDATITRPTPT